MSDSPLSLEEQLKQREEALEDIGLQSDKTGRFVTVLTSSLDIDLPYRIKTTKAAQDFLQSYHTGHSDALQQVRCDELLQAIFEDLHGSKIELMPVYEKELAWKEAGELDEEDLAMTETLGRRLKGLEASILKLAEMRENSSNSFEVVKGIADKAKELDKASTGYETSQAISFIKS